MSSGMTLRPEVITTIARLRFTTTVLLVVPATSTSAQRFDEAITVTVVAQ